MIDSLIGNHWLALLFEVKIGRGRLLVTSLDLSSDLDRRHATRQLRQSILSYVASEQFNPSVMIGSDDMETLFAAHQRKPLVPTRAEVKAMFDRPANT